MPTDITHWLRGLGLEKYAVAFLANDIEAEILPKLTADELIGLGVTSIGHRRQRLDAIAVLRDFLKIYPDDAELHDALGRVLKGAGTIDLAVDRGYHRRQDPSPL